MPEKIPEYIFLQRTPDGGPDYGGPLVATWCDEQIFDTDIKYKRVGIQSSLNECDYGYPVDKCGLDCKEECPFK